MKKNYLKYSLIILMVGTIISCKPNKHISKSLEYEYATTTSTQMIDTTNWVHELIEYISKNIIIHDKSIIHVTTSNMGTDSMGISKTIQRDIQYVISEDKKKDEVITAVNETTINTSSSDTIIFGQREETIIENNKTNKSRSYKTKYYLLITVIIIGIILVIRFKFRP